MNIIEKIKKDPVIWNKLTLEEFLALSQENELKKNFLLIMEQLIKNPDKGSDFEKEMQKIPNFDTIPIEQLILWLQQQGYDMLCDIDKETNGIKSFVAYQKHDKEKLYKIFRRYTFPLFQNQKLSLKLCEDVINNIEHYNIKLGKGTDEVDQVNPASKKAREYLRSKWYRIDEKTAIAFHPKHAMKDIQENYSRDIKEATTQQN